MMTLEQALRTPIKTRAHAERFIETLHATDHLFHFDDDTRDLIDINGESLFDTLQAELAHLRRCELYAFDWGRYECPIGYALHVTGLHDFDEESD